MKKEQPIGLDNPRQIDWKGTGEYLNPEDLQTTDSQNVDGASERLEQQRKRLKQDRLAIKKLILKIQEVLAFEDSFRHQRAKQAREDTEKLFDLLMDVQGLGTSKYLSESQKDKLEQMWDKYESM